MIMPWGKFKGTELAVIPTSYLFWLAGNIYPVNKQFVEIIANSTTELRKRNVTPPKPTVLRGTKTMKTFINEIDALPHIMNLFGNDITREITRKEIAQSFFLDRKPTAKETSQVGGALKILIKNERLARVRKGTYRLWVKGDKPGTEPSHRRKPLSDIPPAVVVSPIAEQPEQKAEDTSTPVTPVPEAKTEQHREYEIIIKGVMRGGYDYHSSVTGKEAADIILNGITE